VKDAIKVALLKERLGLIKLANNRANRIISKVGDKLAK